MPESEANLRSIDVQHAAQGWSGAGYNFGADQDGRKFQIRGWNVGAHNDDENTGTVGVVALGNFVNEKPTDKLVWAIIDIIKEGQARKFPKARIRKHPRVRPHGAGFPGGTDATACPGTKLAAELPRIRKHVNGTV